jgi:hypothetical protein
MSGKDHNLTRLRFGLALLAGDLAPNLFWNPPGVVKPVNFCLGHIRAHPSSSRVGVQINSGAPVGAASFPLVTGSRKRATGTSFALGEICREPVGSHIVAAAAGRLGKIEIG